MAERDRDQSPSAGPQYSRDLTNRCFIARIGRRVTIMSEADMFDHRDSHDHFETSLGEGQSLADRDSDTVYLSLKQLRKLGLVAARPLGTNFSTTRWDEVLDGLVVFREERAPEYLNH